MYFEEGNNDIDTFCHVCWRTFMCCSSCNALVSRLFRKKKEKRTEAQLNCDMFAALCRTLLEVWHSDLTPYADLGCRKNSLPCPCDATKLKSVRLLEKLVCMYVCMYEKVPGRPVFFLADTPGSYKHGGSRRVHEVPLSAGVQICQQRNGLQLQWQEEIHNLEKAVDLPG